MKTRPYPNSGSWSSVRNVDLRRLFRYTISGGLSAATHFGLGLLLSRWLPPVAASTIGFAASVLVSYTLQHAWVFRSTAGHAVAGSSALSAGFRRLRRSRTSAAASARAASTQPA